MFKLPLKGPRKPYITQYYGDKTFVQWYHDNGINIPSHNGIDIICGSAIQTYGTALVCPFLEGKVTKIDFVSPLYTKGNGVNIEAKVGNDTFRLVLWHTGEIPVHLGNKLKEEDIACYLGNSGLCLPAPTTERPNDGAHLHLMLYFNGVLVDPLLYFDKDSWYLGEDSGPQHDLNPLIWMWGKLGITDWWMKLITAFKLWGN